MAVDVPIPGLVRAWAAGWAVSRETPAPVEQPWGVRIDVGQPHHVVRHVLPAADEASVRGVVAAVTVPATHLKAFVAPSAVAGWLTPDWTEGDHGHLMAGALRAATTRVPDGYRLTLETAHGVTRVRVFAADGSPAARGQVAPVGDAAVVDQVETHPDHRRRGLGSVVMRTLGNEAVERGATTGILGATHEGRALYETLGWAVAAPLTAFVYRAVNESPSGVAPGASVAGPGSGSVLSESSSASRSGVCSGRSIPTPR
ncbi:GNAT family N-acetyltransferase [Streptomyces hainanensis]|uniref:GNAT family N-acetyltransferase n=1 Tax=Streptomyces hainanensis TaxID=402648 RepID=A0A4R4TH38_9ACTN|nr:GNAT family N-acetyltransferase [Streptomyces hainanensis]